ncbi:MAG: DNA polymerase I [Clostridia bacterium]
MDKLILLDSNSLMYRAFYALQKSALTDRQGRPTGAIYGFVTMMTKLISDEKPTHIAAAFDLRFPTFRHEMFAPYKATRKPMPDELVAQVPMLKKVLNDFGITILELAGYEADDILGTMAKRFDMDTIIVTGDRDALQLISDNTKICYTKRGISDVIMYDEARLAEDGFTPQSIIDYKALRGDTADNIPGIAGIGEKTAMILLNEYKTLENVLANASKISGKVGERLVEGEAIAKMSYQLATINTDVPLKCKLDDLKMVYPFTKKAKEGLIELDFVNLIKRLKFDTNDETDVLFTQTDISTINVDNLEALIAAVNECVDKPLALTFGVNICFSICKDKQFLVSPSNDLFGELSIDVILETIKPLLIANTDKILYDYKALLHSLNEYNISINGEIYDTLLMAHLVKGSKNFSSMSEMFLCFGFGEQENVSTLFLILERLTCDLNEKNLSKLYYDIELPLENVLFGMEVKGIRVDENVLNELSDKYTLELDTLTNNIYTYSGETFNINSPKQLAVILFDKLKLLSKKKNKTGLSVGIEVLNDLYDEHPIIPLIIRYRQLSKLQSTYVDGLKKVIAGDGRIHTEYKQTVTSTGRLSSVEPNLQNIPTRTSEGREIRRAFVADKGKLLVCADYSQIELRLLAHFSGDENLIKAYIESRDIHASTAAEIFGVSQNEVTSEMRRDAKAVNFGIIYGISDFGLANNLSISARKAKIYIEKYFATYPRVKEYMDKNVAFAEEHGYITTFFGRIRELPEIKSTNHNIREFGKRAAMNLPLQGTAADIIKIAMLEVEKRLKNTNSKMLLQVHDELIIETEQSEAEFITSELKNCMENAVKLSVPLTVNVKTGRSWFEAD